MRKRYLIPGLVAGIGATATAGAFGWQQLQNKKSTQEFLREFAYEFGGLIGYVHGKLVAASSDLVPADKARELARLQHHNFVVTVGMPGIPDSPDFRVVDAQFGDADELGTYTAKLVSDKQTLALLAGWLEALRVVPTNDIQIDGNELTFTFQADPSRAYAIKRRASSVS